MRIDRLTNQLQLAISDAQSLALGKDHNFIDPLHLMSALLTQKNGSVRPLLTQSGVNVPGLIEAVNQELAALATVEGTAGDVHMSNDLGRVLNIADKLSQKNKDTYISSELVLVAFIDADISISHILVDAGLNKDVLLKSIEKVFPPLKTKPYYLMLSRQFKNKHPELSEKIWDTIATLREERLQELTEGYY